MLHYETATPLLKLTIEELFRWKELTSFYLCGGTALGLQLGHRMSVGIDMFTDAAYGSVSFAKIEKKILRTFAYADAGSILMAAKGNAYYLGYAKDACVKVDMFYTEKFIRPAKTVDNIRIASIEDIIAMKLDVISQFGRKKDFWDIHELLKSYKLSQMLALHKERYPHSHNPQKIAESLADFSFADDDFDPICLRDKYWGLIKEDIKEAVEKLQKTCVIQHLT